MMGIKDVAVSSGSACTSASLEPSYVLRALGRRRRARPIRASASASAGSIPRRKSTYVIDHVVREVNRLREMSPALRNGPGRASISRRSSGRHTNRPSYAAYAANAI